MIGRPALGGDLVQPAVGIGVPGLARRAQHAQRRAVVAQHRLVAVGSQSPDQGRRDSEHADPVPLDHVPEPVRAGVVGRALADHERRPERPAAHDLERPHDPAHVRHPHEAVVRADVELERALLGDLHQEPAVDVHRALRPPGRPRRVDHHHRRLRVELRRGQRGALAGDQLVPAVIAPGLHGRFGAEPGPRPRSECTDGTSATAWSAICLHRHRPAPARHGVGREQRDCAGVRQAGGHRGRREAGEDGHDDRPDLGNGVEPGDDLDRHRQEEADGVAPAHAELEQRVCNPVHLVRELGIGDRCDQPVLALPHDRGPARRGAGGVAVDAVVGQVDRAVGEPARPLGARAMYPEPARTARRTRAPGAGRPRPRTIRCRPGCAVISVRQSGIPCSRMKAVTRARSTTSAGGCQM